MKQRVFPVVKGGSSGGGLVIISSNTQSIDNWDCPVLTVEQVLTAYNAIVSGKSVTITDKDGELHFKVVMGDANTSNPSILMQYYWLGWVDYQISEQDTVTITTHKI